MRTEDLRVQALKNPLGINENPVFSWQLVSDKKDEKNEDLEKTIVESNDLDEDKTIKIVGFNKGKPLFWNFVSGQKATFCTESVLEGDGVGWRKSGIRVE